MGLIHERIRKIIELEDCSIASFERKIDVGRNSISSSLRLNSDISHEVIEKIISTFPHYGVEWFFKKNIVSMDQQKKQFLNEFFELLRKWKDIIDK